MKCILLILAILSSLTLKVQPSSSGLGKAGNDTVSLADCFRLADTQNLSLQVAGKGVEKARLMEGTAWDIEKAGLTLSQNPTSGGSPDNALSLSQTIDFPTRYVARRHWLKAETSSRQREAVVVANQLRGQIASLYYELVYERERLRVLRRQDTILSRYETIATARYQAGEARQLEPLSAGRLRHENRLALGMAQTEYANTQAELARLLGTDAWVEPSPQLRPDAGAGLSSSGLQAFASRFSQTPEGRLADARLRVADEAVKVERSAYAPSLTLALRTQMVIKGWNPYHVDRGWNDGNFMGFEVGVGLPLFTKAAKARVRAAKKERERMRLRNEEEAKTRQNEYIVASNRMKAAGDQLAYYASSGISDACKAADISAMAYEKGEISYLEYVSALQQSIDTHLKYIAAVNDYNQATLTLLTLDGRWESGN